MVAIWISAEPEAPFRRRRRHDLHGDPPQKSLRSTGMPFDYLRTVHFPDTDAAGVVFFPAYLSMCHEAYEEALAAAGLDVRSFFSASSGMVIPISRSEADYLRPLRVGDRLRIRVTPRRTDAHSFALAFEMTRLGPPEKVAARVQTHHVCIDAESRGRIPLPDGLASWVDAGT